MRSILHYLYTLWKKNVLITFLDRLLFQKLEFTVVASPKSGWFSHASQIQQELRRIIQSNKDKSNKDQIIEWIQVSL